jgi:hypothetical protein
VVHVLCLSVLSVCHVALVFHRDNIGAFLCLIFVLIIGLSAAELGFVYINAIA